MDYLEWRGDLTFTADPFNDVDNLALSELVYVDLDGIVPGSGQESITLEEASRLFFEKHTREELLAKENFTRMAPFFMERMAASPRFKGTKLFGYTNYINEKTEAQMAVMSCLLDDGTVYVAFRGTDDTVVGWKEDFNLSFMSETEGQKKAVQYLNRMYGGGRGKIRVGGHSKGGNFAVYASAFALKSVRKKIIAVYTNDGPGFRPEVTGRDSYREMLPKIVSIVPESTIVSVLLENDVRHCVVKSSAGGIMQHDALTWQVLGKEFVRAEKRDESSRFFDTTMRNWLSGLPDGEREGFVDSLFAILRSTGAGTLEEIGSDPIRSGTEIIRYIREMPKAEQEEFRGVVGRLLRSGQSTLTEAVKKRLGWGENTKRLPEIPKKEESESPEEHPDENAEQNKE